MDIVYARTKKSEGYVLDISRSGMCIASALAIPSNSRIVIVPKSDILCALKGKVMHVRKTKRRKYSYKLGVKFIFLNKAHKEYLETFISEHVPERRRIPRLSFIE